jgi:putative peptidoglycan lipid II flippase
VTEEQTSAKPSIARTTLLLLPAHVILRAAEPLLPVFLAYWFGRSDATDIYWFAWSVFAFAGSLVFAAYQDSSLVPILAEERIARRSELPKLLGSVLAHTWAVGGVIAVAVGLIAFAWFSIRYDGPSFALAAKMIVPFTLFLLAMCTRTFFSAVLTSERQFFVQPVATALGMVVNLGLLALLHDRLGVVVVPIGALASELLASAILGFYAVKLVGLRIELGFHRPAALVSFAKLVASEVGGGAVTRINPVVDQLMAGLAAVVGGGTMLRLSGDVASVPTSLLQAALLPVLLSHLSDDAAKGDLTSFKSTVHRSLLWVIGLLVVASLLLFAVRTPLLRLVFLHGAMDEAGVDRMATLLPYHLVGLPAFGALLVLARAHVALKNSGIMVSMGIINAASNAFFNLVLLKAIGLEGLALATSCVYCAVALVFFVRLRRKLAP